MWIGSWDCKDFRKAFIQDYYGCTKGFLRKPPLLGPLSCWLLCWHCVSLEVGNHPRSDTKYQLTGCHGTHFGHVALSSLIHSSVTFIMQSHPMPTVVHRLARARICYLDRGRRNDGAHDVRLARVADRVTDPGLVLLHHRRAAQWPCSIGAGVHPQRAVASLWDTGKEGFLKPS